METASILRARYQRAQRWYVRSERCCQIAMIAILVSAVVPGQQVFDRILDDGLGGGFAALPAYFATAYLLVLPWLVLLLLGIFAVRFFGARRDAAAQALSRLAEANDGHPDGAREP